MIAKYPKRLLICGLIVLPIRALATEDSEGGVWDKVKRKSEDVLQSDTVKDLKDKGSKAIDSGQTMVNQVIGTKSTASNRAASHGSIFWEPFGFGPLMPIKSGFSLAWILDADWTLEADYFSGGYGVSISQLDVITITEKLLTANIRWYAGNSFNFRLGFGQRRYKFSLGEDMLATVTADEITYFPALEVQNEIVTMGFGNRWQLDNGITLGCDWFDVNITTGQGRVQSKALLYVKNENDRKNVSNVIKYMRYGPTFDAFKFYIGYTF